jgi:hypothetical protein
LTFVKFSNACYAFVLVKFQAMQRVAVVLLVLLAAACSKEKIVSDPANPGGDKAAAYQEKLTSPERQARETVKMHLGRNLDLRTLLELDWEKFSIVRKNRNMIAVKIPLKNCDDQNFRFLLVNMEKGKPTTFFRNEIRFALKRGKRGLPELVRNYDFQRRKWTEYDLRSNKARNNTGRNVEKKSLVAPGGSLPLITIVGTYSDGSAGGAFSGDIAYMMAGMFGVSTNAGTGSLNNGILDYLDPLYVPDAGGSNSLLTEVIEWEMDETDQADQVNLNEYLKCFDNIPDAGSNFSIKIMVDIPVDANPNSLINVGATGLSVGHVFMTLTKSNGNQSVSQTLGFYPSSGFKSLTLNPVTSKIANDGEFGDSREFNASLTLDGWNAAEFKALLNQLRFNSTMRYEIDGFNCANFVGTCLNAVRPGTLGSIATMGVNPLNPTELVNIPWSPNGVYKSLIDLKVSNSPLASKVETNVVKKAGTSAGPCN